MSSEDYTISARVDSDVATTEQRVRKALADEGFGVLTEIDVQSTLREKLEVEMPAYRILGACNPSLAHQALQADPAIGSLLPCNVVVREHPDGGSEIMAADPQAMLSVAKSAAVQPIADDATQRITRAVQAAAGTT